MDGLLENLIRSPRLQQYRDRIDEVLRREQTERQKYYDNLTEDGHVEFINGEVVVHSPAQHAHNSIVRRLTALLSAYVAMRRLGVVGAEKYLISLTRNDYEPDICYWDPQTSRSFAQDQLQFPAPQFIVEVLSPTTQAHDRGVKLEDYAAHGVQEYWIIDASSRSVEQYLLKNDQFELHATATSGTLSCRAIPGFEIPHDAIFDEDPSLAALQKILSHK